MSDLLQRAVGLVRQSNISFCKFITPNDTGATGAHQAGFHLPKNAWPLFFDTEGQKGENKDSHAVILWHDEFETHSRFIYYGVGTRDEYRLTRFGRGFPFLTADNVGDLLVIAKVEKHYYKAYVLSTEEDIETFFAEVGISSTQTNKLIPKTSIAAPEDSLIACFSSFLKTVHVEFPTTNDLALNARNCYNASFQVSTKDIVSAPDKLLLAWINAEFQLFKVFESDRYGERIKKPFNTVDELIEYANTILNRRKSRAGKSLEHHLSEVFTVSSLRFENQAITEDNKRPDFLFPGREGYYNLHPSKIATLAAKTTCKDRWRQILNEADKVKTKHLFTLQQGISKNQLDEMYKYGVQLVVPKEYVKSFPVEYRHKIMDLNGFIGYVKALDS